jgi:phosphate starvation-inducible PhoH-like protein
VFRARVRAAESLLRLVEKGEVLNDQNVGYCIDMVMEDSEAQMAPLTDGCICITAKGKPVKPKTVGQKNYCDNIRNNTITIGVGPAGTGKTYLAVAMAVTAFPCAAGEPHHLDAPRRGSRREAGFSAR